MKHWLTFALLAAAMTGCRSHRETVAASASHGVVVPGSITSSVDQPPISAAVERWEYGQMTTVVVDDKWVYRFNSRDQDLRSPEAIYAYCRYTPRGPKSEDMNELNALGSIGWEIYGSGKQQEPLSGYYVNFKRRLP